MGLFLYKIIYLISIAGFFYSSGLALLGILELLGLFSGLGIFFMALIITIPSSYITYKIASWSTRNLFDSRNHAGLEGYRFYLLPKETSGPITVAAYVFLYGIILFLSIFFPQKYCELLKTNELPDLSDTRKRLMYYFYGLLSFMAFVIVHIGFITNSGLGILLIPLWIILIGSPYLAISKSVIQKPSTF